MKITFSTTDCLAIFSDRDDTLAAGTNPDEHIEGFDLRLGDTYIHFERDTDALNMAKSIAERMGYKLISSH